MTPTAPAAPYRRLSRPAGDGRPAAPVSQVHLGLGSFFRAHQAWYTEHCPDRDAWGIAAFTGRSSALADALTSQDNLYTLVTRGEEQDQFEVIGSLSAAHPAADHQRFLRYLAAPQVRVLTLTVTEAGYCLAGDGRLDLSRPAIQADLATLRTERTGRVGTVPARLTAGLAARYASGGAAITIVPCDNLPDNGGATAAIVRQFAELLDPGLAGWIHESVSFASTVVDRITPMPGASDVATVAAQTHRDDRAPVVTEPFSEWIIGGSFPAGRPAWEQAGAVFADSITPFEQRKLRLLNGGHSLLAYAGSLRGHQTIATAVADQTCLSWLAQWWQEASADLDLPSADLAAYQRELLARWANHRIHHRLAQIAADGSQKLRVRVLPVVRAERNRGRMPAGAVRILAAWLCHLRGAGAPVDDPRAAELTALAGGPLDRAARQVLTALSPDLGDDGELQAAVRAAAQELCG
jgi:fructuronate reductase